MKKEVLFYTSKWIELVLLFLFTFNLLLAGYSYGTKTYPMIPLAITTVAFWLYHYKLKVFSLPFLVLAAVINIQHFGYDPFALH
jgi:antibiotic biosynthesis monooxygenase (ABM) superfamily enzyme